MQKVDASPPYAVTWETADDGWQVMRRSHPGRILDIYGAARFRRDGQVVRSQIDVGPEHQNVGGAVLGGFLLAYVDLIVSMAPVLLDCYEQGQAVTMHCSTHFLAPGNPSGTLEAVAEIVSETRKTVIVRGYLVQEQRRIAAFDGTMRKISGAKR